MMKQSPADRISVIRSSLSLSTNELARILGVQRSTVYTWMHEEVEPQSENLSRLNALLEVAKHWATLTDLPMGEDVRLPHFVHGNSIVDLLCEGIPINPTFTTALEILAREIEDRNETRRKMSVSGILAAHGRERIRSDETIDMLTGKRIGPEPLIRHISRTSLSPEAREARRPPSPVDLLEALQDRPVEAGRVIHGKSFRLPRNKDKKVE